MKLSNIFKNRLELNSFLYIVNKELSHFRVDLNNLKYMNIFFVFLCSVKNESY